ncbi:MAG: L,D-transpeptidase family protein [Acetatifactor sp.]|nr:L,D-transpeptidase family protein [Acetatifactor sp.]
MNVRYVLSIFFMMITLVTSITENAQSAGNAQSVENAHSAGNAAGAGEIKPEGVLSADSPAWVASLGDEKEATQLLVVAATGQTTALISMHEKDENGNWREILSTSGYIGKKGLGKTIEGDEKTPQGTFHFNAAFGIAKDPGCTIPYHQVTKDDYWSGDPRDGYAYNQLVSIKDYPGLDVKNKNTEHIIDVKTEYQYCLNISYNEECVPRVGGAIFLHCTGKKTHTGGCVAIPKDDMVKVMRSVKEDCVVVIDSLKTLSPP